MDQFFIETFKGKEVKDLIPYFHDKIYTNSRAVAAGMHLKSKQPVCLIAYGKEMNDESLGLCVKISCSPEEEALNKIKAMEGFHSIIHTAKFINNQLWAEGKVIMDIHETSDETFDLYYQIPDDITLNPSEKHLKALSLLRQGQTLLKQEKDIEAMNSIRKAYDYDAAAADEVTEPDDKIRFHLFAAASALVAGLYHKAHYHITTGSEFLDKASDIQKVAAGEAFTKLKEDVEYFEKAEEGL